MILTNLTFATECVYDLLKSTTLFHLVNIIMKQPIERRILLHSICQLKKNTSIDLSRANLPSFYCNFILVEHLFHIPALHMQWVKKLLYIEGMGLLSSSLKNCRTQHIPLLRLFPSSRHLSVWNIFYYSNWLKISSNQIIIWLIV